MTHHAPDPAPPGTPAPEPPIPPAPAALADAMPQLVWIARDDGTVEYYNQRVALYGGPRQEGDAWRWQPIVHPDDIAGTLAAWRSAVESGTSYEFEHRLRMADGSWCWHLSRAVPVREGPRAARRWYGTATEIHELREAQEALRRTQASLGLAMRGGRMGWWSRDMATDQVTWSAELAEIVGLPPGAFGGDERAFYALVHPDDAPAVAREVEAAVAEHRDYVVEFRYRHADGSWRWMEGRGRAVYESGRPTWLFGIGIDINERKEADELRDLFIGMLSHELRTPVTSIFGGAQLLRRDGLDGAARRELVAGVVAESERLERLVENLLVLARVERNGELGGRDPVLLRPLVGRVVGAERRSHPEATVRVSVEPGLPPAVGDEASVELCLRNLLSNALKYGPREGPVDVRVARHGEEVGVTVEDRGPGVPEEGADRMFELFYRSPAARRSAAGAGIGLYVVRALVGSMGGRPWARSRPDGGAELGFTLPVFREPGPLEATADPVRARR